MVDACVMHGILPFYGPFGDIKDIVACEDQFRNAYLLGCVGAWSLHPAQIEIAKRVFSPRPADVRAGAAGDRRDGRRHRRDHARRQDGGRRLGEAVPGGRRTRARQLAARDPSSPRRTGSDVMSDADRDLRPRRSVLYMPAANERALEKAKTIPADAIIFDLEDAVAPDAKPRRPAERRRRGALRRVRRPRADDPLQRPRHAVGRRRPRRGGDVGRVRGRDPQGRLGRVRSTRSRRCSTPPAHPQSLTIWAMIETPTAIFDVRAIAAHPRVSVLVMGTNDLARELRSSLGAAAGTRCSPTSPRRSPPLARPARSILDGVYNDVKDLDGFRAECVQGFEMGFDGKTLIHPGQVEIANEVWAPSEDEVAHARRVIAAFEEGLAEGRGVVTVDGRMIENLHVANAQRVLAVADAIAALG